MEIVFYTFCTFLPIHLLAYLPFMEVLRFGKGWMAATVAGNITFHLLGVGWAVAAGRPDMVAAAGFIMVPISLALYFLNIKLAPSKLLFTYVLLVNYQVIVMGISAFITVAVFDAPVRSLTDGLVSLALFGAAWLPMYRLFRYAARQVYRIDAPQLWRVIWLIPAIMSAIVAILTSGFQDISSWKYLFARAGLLLCVVVVYWVLLHSLEGVQRQAALQEQLVFESHLLEVQAAEQKKHSQLMMENTALLRQQRHDLRHQLAAIQHMADTDPERLKVYLSGLLKDIPAAPKVYCENPAVNAIVSYYNGLCEARQIAFDVHLIVPARTAQVTDGELCVIFGNLLENAVEACGRMTQGQKYVRLKSVIQGDMLTVSMDNSFNGQVCVENGRYRSSKRDDYGVGLSSVQAVARKNQGDAWFEANGTAFRSWVYIQV